MDLKRVAENVWEIPKNGEMRVPARLYASDALIQSIKKDKTLEQARNVACLPGIERMSYVMPDAHQGYGFPIGGVAAFDEEEGIITPGGVGYDINCGVLLMRSDLTYAEVHPKVDELIDRVFSLVPCGVGVGS